MLRGCHNFDALHEGDVSRTVEDGWGTAVCETQSWVVTPRSPHMVPEFLLLLRRAG